MPPTVIQKFHGDSMNFWLFFRQFEVHVLGKVKNYELFLLLYQNCESHVQAKMKHLSNQPCVTGFQMARHLLYDEYGHSHEIAHCYEECLRTAAKVCEDD